MPDSTEPPLDRRRQRGLRTREALVQAALERFERFGFDKTTVDEIAADVGMSPRTLFHHFGSKEMLLFAGYAERLQEATRQFRSCDPALPLTTALDATADSIVTAISVASSPKSVVNLITGFNATEEVSLKGSPTVSPTTVAAWSGVPFSRRSTSTTFLALSQLPPAFAMNMAW